MKTFKEWETTKFTGGLHGGRSIAKLAWNAAMEEAAILVEKTFISFEGIDAAATIREHKESNQ